MVVTWSVKGLLMYRLSVDWALGTGDSRCGLLGAISVQRHQISMMHSDLFHGLGLSIPLFYQ